MIQGIAVLSSLSVSRRPSGLSALAYRRDEVIPMSETMTGARSLPLTDLSEDERMFRDQVRQFAEAEVRPLVAKMDKEAQIPRGLIDHCFEMGIMGIEIPDDLGGAG